MGPCYTEDTKNECIFIGEVISFQISRQKKKLQVRMTRQIAESSKEAQMKIPEKHNCLDMIGLFSNDVH